MSSGPSELDLSLLGENSSLADVSCKYDEVRLWFIYLLSAKGDLVFLCSVIAFLSISHFEEEKVNILGAFLFILHQKYCRQICKSRFYRKIQLYECGKVQI